LENRLAREILAGHFATKDTVRVDVRGGQFVFVKDEAAEVA
jgi:ATP-dependent Clp protease ATP-binding subunit ClpB